VEEKEIHDELSAIRGLMERSSKFISLSGLSGILAGIYALIGAVLAHYYVLRYEEFETEIGLITLGIIVLTLSILTGLLLTKNQAKKKGQSIWGKTSQSLLFHMSIPLITGGILTVIFVSRGYYGIIGPTMLIFYGLSLVSASNFTFTDVKYLGLLEIVLGLIAACFPGYGLLFWAIGFGVLHIVYGSMMYLKYDR
jgi:hypothetical protein